MTDTPRIVFRAAVLNSPDPQALARFYARLLGWTIAEVTLDLPDLGSIGSPSSRLP